MVTWWPRSVMRGLAALGVAAAGCDPQFIDPVVRPPVAVIHVAPTGNDDHDGATAQTPLRTLQAALDRAGPGDVVELAPGDYFENVRTRRDGLPTAPVIIRGPRAAIVHGQRQAGVSRAFEINHSYVHLEGFAIDGFFGGDPARPESYQDKLVYVQGRGVRTGVVGFRALGLELRNAGGECLRLRYFVRNGEIARCTIRNCGLRDFRFGGPGKNGEGIYVGTSPSDVGDGKNPTAEPDRSQFNHIHDNDIDTQGNDCIDVKEAAGENLIENNRCRGQQDVDSAGISVRSSGNRIVGNDIGMGAGVGLRLGGDGDGVNNTVTGNTLRDNAAGAVRIEVGPQGPICGNLLQDNGDPAVRGDAGDGIDPTRPCP